MTELNRAFSRDTELRRRAQAQQIGQTQVTANMSQNQIQELVHELQTHQIELEMQNEDLRNTQKELTEARDRYSDLYDFAPCGHVTVGAKGMILEANLTLAKMLGIEREALLKHPLSAFVVPEDQDVLYRYSKQRLAGKRCEACQLRMLSGNNKRLWVELDSHAIEDSDSDDAQLRMHVINITERKKIEREREASKKLEELRFHEEILNAFRARMVKTERLASVGTLSAMVAHQMSQPLTVARLSIQNAMATANDSLDPAMLDLQACLGGIEDTIEAVKRFRDFARCSPERHCSDFEVLALVSRVHKLLHRSCAQAQVLVQYEQLASIPTFHWHEKELEQLVYILMENAIQAAPGDSPQQLVISGRMDTGGLQLSFADTCGGILETHETKIFEPFFTTKMTHENTGLGLCVVARILEDLGGRIETENHPDEGVTFHLSLPLKGS